MFGSLIYVFLSNVTQIIISKVSQRKEEPYQYNINILNVLAFFCSFIGFMIYLEIIELNFCKLNYNLRKHINERSIKDIYEDNSTESIISDNDNNEGYYIITNNVELPFNKKI
jgi:nucleoside permease NupC